MPRIKKPVISDEFFYSTGTAAQNRNRAVRSAIGNVVTASLLHPAVINGNYIDSR